MHYLLQESLQLAAINKRPLEMRSIRVLFASIKRLYNVIKQK